MSNSFPLSWWIPSKYWSRFSCRTFPWVLLPISRQLNWCCLKTTENGTYVFDVFDVFGFSASIHGDSLIPCCLFRRAFTPTTLECLRMTHSWLKIISGVQRTGDRWQRIELGETRCHEQLLCCKIWDSFTALSAQICHPANHSCYANESHGKHNN